MQLHPCQRCRRHIRDTTCPFCGAEQKALLAKLVHAGGRLSRAAVFAGAAACYTNANTQQQQPPPPPPPDGENFAEPPPGDPAMGTIQGTVTEAGTLVPNTSVVLQGESGAMGESRTDARGRFVFPNLKPGRYLISLMGNGNPRQEPARREVVVEAGRTATGDLQVQPYVPDRGPCCKPYGAPPARRRIV